ncbi:YcnI family protein [Amycolatopsis acidicola]|uniref:YcnI family copper-binding membrane protein n=1 Tax=Amycolatopsis acidicola TaxID=2596893 RepID=UPI001FB6CA5F|nr:YcnI family protein [Amycolatopsis acidicola]
MSRSLRRLTVVCAAAVLAVFAVPASASAHVTANPGTAEQGGYAKVSFRVPNERDDASTTQLEIDLPADHPLASVSTRAVPGWTAQVQKTPLAQPITTDDGQLTEAVSKIVWTGGKIPPGQFEEFDVSIGPLPTDTGELAFKALQTYDNGEIVRWIDTASPGAPEPEHPAPTLTLTPKNAAVQAAAVSDTQDPGSSTGIVLGIIALVVAVAALAVAVLRRPRTRAE